jgi:hypothetical protein
METRTKTAPPDGSLAPLADTDLRFKPGDEVFGTCVGSCAEYGSDGMILVAPLFPLLRI